MGWHTLFQAGGTNHLRVAILNQYRAFGMFGVMAGDVDGAELSGSL